MKYIRTGILLSIIVVTVLLAFKFHASDTKELLFIEGGDIQHAIDTNQYR